MKDLAKKIFSRFAERGWTLSAGESCTAGLLSATLGRTPGISKIFLGSAVTYSNGAKTNLLGVPPKLISSNGAVSAEVAISMAQGACKRFESEWGIGITGIAGPDGGTKEKPVGTVWFGIFGPGVEYVERQVFEGTREQVQQRAVEHAFSLLLEKSL